MATVTRREFWDRLELALYGKTGNTFGAATMIGIDELYDDLASPPAEVGCERPDGTLNIHSASEVCEVCSPRVEAAQTPPAKDAPCPACHGSGGDRWHESDGSEHGEKCPRCDGFGRAQAPPASAPPISAAWARVWQGVEHGLAALASDPPGLAALVKELADSLEVMLRHRHGQAHNGDVVMAGKYETCRLCEPARVLIEEARAYPLPASPQAETTKGDR